jgi:hypothetical protein
MLEGVGHELARDEQRGLLRLRGYAAAVQKALDKTACFRRRAWIRPQLKTSLS